MSAQANLGAGLRARHTQYGSISPHGPRPWIIDFAIALGAVDVLAALVLALALSKWVSS